MLPRKALQMRFQQLVFRTTPHSLVEWLDGELEKRGIDCVYTHCVLSILQEDSDDTEPDECIDVKNNQQKVYHKYGGPESLFSATKSKHQKWKTYGKQILLTTSISGCDTGISDLEKKNKIAAINCLKSVSDDSTIEDLIEEVCLKLKSIRNINKKNDSVKSLDIVDKDTAFFIPPSSPTDQVEKYFAAFPPLNKKVEEKIDSCQVAHLNAWYSNCIKKNKNIVQDIFKNSNLNSFQKSEVSKCKQSNTYGSLKSIENIYQPKNNNSKVKNRYKISSPSKHDKNLKFSDENGYSQLSVKSSNKIDTNSSTLSKNTEKLRNHKINNANNEMHKSDSDGKRKSIFLSSTAHQLSSDCKKVKNSIITDITSNRFSVLMEEETSKITSSLIKMDTENSIMCDATELDENVTSEIPSNPCKKFKSCENVTESIEESTCSCGDEKAFDLSLKTIDSKVSECNEGISEKNISCLTKSKHRKKIPNKDSRGISINDFSQITFTADEKETGKKSFVEMTKIGSNKKESKTEPLKCLTNIKKKKKSSKIKIGIALSSFENKINSKIPRSESESLCFENMKVENICEIKTGNSMEEKADISSERFLCVSKYFKHKDKSYKEEVCNAQFMKNNIFDVKEDACSVVEINCAKSNTIVFCDKRNVHLASVEKSSIKSFKQKENDCSDDKSDICEMNLHLPLYEEEISHQNFTLPLANINLIIGNNIYYNFNPWKALDFFSPNEIFNIITVGDINEVNNFLRKFSVKSDLDLNGDNVLTNQDKKCIEFHYIDSKDDDDDSPPIKKISNSSLHLTVGNKEKSSFSANSLQLMDSQDMNSGHSNEDINFCSSSLQQEVNERDTSVFFGNWNYNVFFDLYKEKTGNLRNCDHINDVQSTSSFSDSFDDKEKSNAFSSKQSFNENNCKIDSLEQFYNVKNKIICSEAFKVPYNDYIVSPDYALFKNHNFEEKTISPEITVQSGNDFFSCLKPNVVSSDNGYKFKIGSAFKLAQKIEPFVICHSNRGEQNLLRKVINIDRMIYRINAKNRVTVFQNSQDISFTLPHDISSEISSFSSCKEAKVHCCIVHDSYESNLSCNIYKHSDWPKPYSSKSDESLRSIWDNKISSLGCIWENNIKSGEYEDTHSSHIVSDSSNLCAIHKDSEEQQEELLKGIYSMPDLKEETNLYSDDQPISNQIYESSYSVNLENESLPINAKEFTGISASMHDIPVQTATKISDSNKTFDFSLSVPHADPVGVFSLENCKQDVDPQISCSEISFQINVKDDAYQESDYIDVSAFRGPYGSYSENRTNYFEGGGWSLDSDNYLLDSETFHDRSSSLHELNTTGLENENFQYMPVDGQQLSLEDDELVQMNATRWLPNNMRRRVKHKCPTSRRPCAFYMEGNCNRSDCKFSHDLSNITCRFWQEGSCFKGSTCPFLHGYADDRKIVDQHCSVKKREPEHKYSLDSEADFPSLSAAKCEKMPVAKSEPLDIVNAKGLKNIRTNH